MSFKGIAKLAYNALLRKEFPMLKPGTKAPSFDLSDHRGKQVSLDALAGRYIVLWFFPKADTPG